MSLGPEWRARLGAGELVAAPGTGAQPEADAVAVVAVTVLGDDAATIAWVGDARAWGWGGLRLRPYSPGATMSGQLRRNSHSALEVAYDRDSWVRARLATVVVAAIYEAEFPDPVVSLSWACTGVFHSCTTWTG